MFKDKFGHIKDVLINNRRILISMALCVAIIAVTGAASNSVRFNSDLYLNNISVPDIIISSNDGFTSNDVELIKEQTNADVIGVFYTDCRYTLNDTTSSLRIFSKDGCLNADNIISGDLISDTNQCIATKYGDSSELKIGDIITVESDAVSSNKFTVVGIVEVIDPDFENSIIIDNSVFSLNYYNRLLLNCSYLRRYNTYSDRYIKAVNDIIGRLDNIANNRLADIKSGDYDYRLLNISRYDSELAERVDFVYNQKEELEKAHRELAVVKNYIDQNELIIAEKSEQLSISLETIYETVGAELREHENKLYELTELKIKFEQIEKERSSCESELAMVQFEIENANKYFDTVTDKESASYLESKAVYDKLVLRQTELKSEINKKADEYKKIKTKYDSEYAKFDAAYSSAKKTYDRLMNDTGIDSHEIFQISLTNLNARTEYNAKFEEYNSKFAIMQKEQEEVISSVNTLYSSYAKIWYLTDRSIVKEYNDFRSFVELTNIVNISVFIFSVVFLLYLIVLEIRKYNNNQKGEFGVVNKNIKSTLLFTITIGSFGLMFGLTVGYVFSILLNVIIFTLTSLPFSMPIVNLQVLFEIITVCVLPLLICCSIFGFDILKRKDK